MDLSMIIGLVAVGVTITAVVVACVRRGVRRRWDRPAYYHRERDGAHHAGMFGGFGGGGFGGDGGGCDGGGGGGGCGGGSC